MKIVILEDEPLAAEKLERYIHKLSLDIEVMAILPSLKKAVPWLTKNQEEVDLLFMDIQLQDGLSFEIFSSIKVMKPVIFTTAFDEYAIDAFKVNSIDYLLKPISFLALKKAIDKYDNLRQQFTAEKQIKVIAKKIEEQGYKSRFLVKMGNLLRSVTTDKIAYFFAEGRDAFLVVEEGKRYLIEYKLEELETFLDKSHFYRNQSEFNCEYQLYSRCGRLF